MIMALRSDKPEAEIYLVSDGKRQEYSWLAHRSLADDIIPKIEQMLIRNNATFEDLKGLIIFTGEGSFTGLRIGTTVLNTLSYSLNIPIVGSTGSDWLEKGLKDIVDKKTGQYILPKYSSEPNITKPKRIT